MRRLYPINPQRRLAKLTANAYNQTRHYDRCRSDSYGLLYFQAKLAASFQSEAVTIASTRCAYPRRDGQAESARVTPLVYLHDSLHVPL